MSIEGLRDLVGQGVVSDEFCKGIMNGKRAELIARFDLDPDEIAALLAIRADTLYEFAVALEKFLRSRTPLAMRRSREVEAWMMLE